jgi:hypothetical protein
MKSGKRRRADRRGILVGMMISSVRTCLRSPRKTRRKGQVLTFFLDRLIALVSLHTDAAPHAKRSLTESHRIIQPSHRPLSETFGKLPADTPLLFLFSGKDRSFPWAKTTPAKQFERWERAANKDKKEDGGGKVKMQFGVMEGASHQVDEVELQPKFREVVEGFLKSV